MLLGLVAVTVSAALTGAAAWLGWWAMGGGALGVLSGLFLGSYSAHVGFRRYVPLAFIYADAGSIRQARKALKEARRDGRPLTAMRARARLRLVRWQRK